MMSEDTARAYATAWSTGDSAGVASYYAVDGAICINRGEESRGREQVTAMAAGFHAEFPDLVVHMDSFRATADHALFVWTLEGHHATTGNHVKVQGWEEWDLTPEGKVAYSLGWFDAADYDRQVAGG